MVKALGQIRVDTATTLEGLIHFLTVDRATCIVFSQDDLPPEGSSHIRLLYISVACSGHRMPTILLDNDSTLMFGLWLQPLPLAFLHLILGLLHRPSELMTGLRG